MGRIAWDLALSAMLLAFAISSAISWIYALTYRGIGYMRSFAQTIALAGPVAALVMLAIGDDIARGLGMVGALTLVRFRATLKDPRDLMFVFAALGAGVACGVQAFAVAILGSAVFVAASLYVSWSSFGSRRQFDALVRFRTTTHLEDDTQWRSVLERHARKLALVDVRSDAGFSDHAYHLELARPDSETRIVQELSLVPGVSEPTVVKQDATLEL